MISDESYMLMEFTPNGLFYLFDKLLHCRNFLRLLLEFLIFF